MPLEFIFKKMLGALPVLMFLTALVQFDSFKLVRLRLVLMTITAGAFAAVVGAFANTELIAALNMSYLDYSHTIAPWFEEILKALVIIFLIQTSRIGFAFDAAILGFAAGAGFALVENFYYLTVYPDKSVALWVIRGFGTAIMHGGTTAVFAMMGHVLSLRADTPGPQHYIPGFLFAALLHTAFNFFNQFPTMSTLAMMLALPAAMAYLLRRDQKSIHHWLEVDFENHKILLAQIRSGEYEKSEAGRFLTKLHGQFDSKVVDKMVYYIELHTELILAAEEVLSAHERGETKSVSAETKEKLVLLHEVEQEIGKTGLLALRPHLKFNRHEFWELYMLEKEAGFAHPRAH